MAQVKKYQSGGTVNSPVGKFIKDGQEYIADENFFKQLDAFSQSLDQDQRLHLSDVRDALRRGETVSYDSYKNEISPNVNFSNINERQNQRLERRPTRTGSFFDALFNTGRQRGAKAISALNDFNVRIPTPELPKLTELNFTKSSLNYNTDENGNKVYSNNPNNEAIVNRVKNLVNYYTLGNEGDNNYRILGIDNESVRDFNAANPNRLSTILENIKNSSLTDEDRDILRTLNIYDSDPAKAVAAAETQQVEQPTRLSERISANGFNQESLSNTGVNLQEDSDGNLYWTNATNDWYLGGHEAFTGTPYEQGVVYRGRLYTPQQAQSNQEVIDRFRGFYNAWNNPEYDYNTRFDAAATGDIMFRGNESNPFSQTFNPETEYFDSFQDYFSNLGNGTYNIADLTSSYNLGDTERLLSYIGPNSQRNYLGIPSPSFVYKNANGELQQFNNINELPFNRREGFYTPSQLSISAWETSGGNKYAPYKSFSIKDGQKDFIYTDQKGRKFLKTGSNRYDLITNNELLNEILANPSNYTRSDISKLVKGKQANIPINALPATQAFKKDGGKIPTLPKLQYGGIIQNSQTNVERQNNQGQTGSISTAAKLKDIKAEGGNALTSADKWELGALAGDLGALVASIPTGGNPVAAGIGAGSTVAQFISDVKRDGLDWGDVGRAAGSLGLDAITLLPGAGVLGKSAKTIRALKRSSKLLGGLFAGYGLSAAAGSLAKLTKEGNDNDWTIDDLRNVLVGVQSVIGGKRLLTDTRLATRPGKRVKQKTPEGIRLTSKSQPGLEVNLSNQELTNISKLKGPQRNTALENLVVDKATNSQLNRNALNIEKYLNNDGTLKPEATKGLLADFGLDRNKLTSRLAVWNKEKTLALPKQERSGLFKRAERTPRELRNIQNDATGFLPKVRQTLQNRAIRRYTTENPTNNTLFGTREGWFTGQEIPVYGKARYVNGRLLGREQPYNLSKPTKGVRKLVDNGTFTLSRIQEGTAAINKNQPIYRYYATNRSGKSKDFENARELVNYLKAYKKGGKIEIFQSGGRVPWAAPLDPNDLYQLDPLNPSYQKYYHGNRLTPVSNLDRAVSGGVYTTGAVSKGLKKSYDLANKLPSVIDDISSSTIATQAAKNAQVTSNNIKRTKSLGANNWSLASPTLQVANPQANALAPLLGAASASTASSNIGTPASSVSGKSGFFRTLPKLNIDKDSVLSLTGLIGALGYNRRAYNVKDKALQSAMQAGISSPQEIYPSFTDYGVNAAYEQAARRQLNYKPVTSDSLTALAMEQQAKNAADQLRLEGRLKTSELFSNYQNQTNELRRNYAGIRNDVANQNRQRLAQLNLARAENKAGKLTNDFTSLNNWLLEKRNNLAQDKQRYEAYNDLLLQNELGAQTAAADNAIFSPYRNEYNALPEDVRDQYSAYGSDAWRQWLRNTNPEQYNSLEDQIRQKALNLYIPYFNSNLRNYKVKRPSLFQKGGKTTKKSLNAAEQIWIQQNKDAASAVKLLNENVLKLFLQATS